MAKKGLMASRINSTNSLNSNQAPKKQTSPSSANTSKTRNITFSISKPKLAKEKREKKSGFSKKEKPLYQAVQSSSSQEENSFDYSSFEQELESEFESKTNHSEVQVELNKRFVVSLQIIIVVLCVYVCFLIYGLLSTNYSYNAEGNIEPVVLSVSDLRVLNEYESITSYYLRARIVYEDTLELDYKLSQQPEDSLLIAMEYTALLDTVDKLAVDLNAAEYSTKYTALYNQLNSWVTTDIAVYLQKMATAITNNDATAANDAVIARDIVYSDFAQITANIATIASNTKGVSNIDLYTWTPENYIEDLQGGE